MYEELDSFERALQHFGTRVEIISAMEIAKKLSSEDAYQMIKGELKELKKVRKKMKQEP
jgi:transcription termination factor NusB